LFLKSLKTAFLRLEHDPISLGQFHRSKFLRD